MREPHIFLLAVAGFLVLSVVYFATMKGTGAYGETSCPGPYWFWAYGTKTDSCISRDQWRGDPGKGQSADSAGVRYGFSPEDMAGEMPGQNIADADEELSCTRCHVAGESDDLFHQGGG